MIFWGSLLSTSFLFNSAVCPHLSKFIESSWFDRWLGPVGEQDNGSSEPVGITIGYDDVTMSSSIGSATSTWRMTTTNIFDDYTLTLNFSKLSKNEAMLASPFQAGKRVLRIDKKIRLMSVSEKPAHLPLPKPDINLINLLSVGFCLVKGGVGRCAVARNLTLIRKCVYLIKIQILQTNKQLNVHVHIWRRSVNNKLTNTLTYSIGLWQIPSNLPCSVFFSPRGTI